MACCDRSKKKNYISTGHQSGLNGNHYESVLASDSAMALGAPKSGPAHASGFSIEGFERSDYASICRVHNEVYRDYPRTIGELMHDDRAIEENGYFLNRIVAREKGSKVVGYGGMMERVEQYQPGSLFVEVAVEPRSNGSGLWRSLYRELEVRARSRKAKLLKATAIEHDPFARDSWREMGLEEKSAGVESRLDLGKLCHDELSRRLALFDDREIAFSTLAKEKRLNPKCESEIYDFETRAGVDVPATDRWRVMTMPEYHDLVFASPSVTPSAWFLAKKGSRYVGETSLLRNRLWPNRSIGTGFTCVIQDFRGKGLARHLKLTSFKWAKEHGYACVRTWNDSDNGPMLTLNRELGFKRHALWFRLEKRLR